MTTSSAQLSRHSYPGTDGEQLSVLLAQPRPAAPTSTSVPPPILAVHGFASSARAGWERTGHLEALTRAGRTVLAVDLRGHGRSAKPHTEGAYSVDVVLADLVGAVRSMTVSPDGAVAGPVDLLGYSLGARLCWTLAQRDLLAIRRLVLGGFDGRPLFSGPDPAWLRRLAAVGGNDAVALGHLVDGLRGTGGADTGADAPVPLPSQPTLVVAGTRDPLASGAEAFAASLPGGRFVAIPDRDHISAVPSARFRRAVVDFLAP